MASLDFLFELGTEELPPTSLTKLSSAFSASIADGLKSQGLNYTNIKVYATPRRIAVLIDELDLSQPDTEQVRLGPAVAAAFDQDGEPTKAASGFAKSCQLSVSDLDQIETDKGTRLGITIINKGKETKDLIGSVIESALQSLPIAKAMRWGNRDETFVRPVKWLVALLGEQIIPLSLYGCRASNITRGHRFMSAGDIVIKEPRLYEDTLFQESVIADQNKRKDLITEQLKSLADQHDLVAVIEPSLLDEVSALVEWPVALMGNFEQEFLSVPKEALISTMSKNQKYFHLLTKQNELANKFITIANLESSNPAAIVEGNERVIRPRLADAKFFYRIDSKQSLTEKSKQLETIVFQTSLGSVADKCRRVANVAASIAPLVDANPELVQQAAVICKADLVTEMVGEFPNLQGIMGKYYAQLEGLDNEVCESLEEIYLPKSATDRLPTTAIGTCLALADRIDTLVGIFGIQQLPTGNKDPYALRRAALGIIRIINDQLLPINLVELITQSINSFNAVELHSDTKSQLLEFFASRSKALYLDNGVTAQVIAAVDALNITSPVDFNKRLHAVQVFADLDSSVPLSAANKRVANILTKNNVNTNRAVNPKLLSEPSEIALYDLYASLKEGVEAMCSDGDYDTALNKLVSFANPLEDFFTDVMVMVEDEAIKENRIALLAGVRSLFLSVADISYLQK